MKVYLCDDNEKVIAFYGEKLKFLCKKHNIDFEFFPYMDSEKMLFDFETEKVLGGVVFLDIQMPKMDGLTLARKLRDLGCHNEIIFLTLSKEHFLAAFDVGAFNYIIKGETSDRRFEEIFLSAVKSAHAQEQEYVVFTAAGEHRTVALQSISHFEVMQRIITVYYGKEQFRFFSSLQRLEAQLYGKHFIRVHRSYMVSVPKIQALTYTELKLNNGVVLPVGRKYYPVIKSAMEQYFNTIYKKQG